MLCAIILCLIFVYVDVALFGSKSGSGSLPNIMSYFISYNIILLRFLILFVVTVQTDRKYG